jgi:hypothetical protein
MVRYENHAGFNITGSKLQLVEIVNRDDQFIIENVDEAFFSESVNFNSDKDTKISTLLQGAYNELSIRKPLKSSTVSFTLPFELFYIVQIPFDNTLLHQDLIEEFKFQLSILYPFVPQDDLVIQYLEVDKGNYVNTNTAIVIALRRRFLKLIDRFCQNNKLKLKFVDNVHVASERALSISHPIAEQNLVLSVFFNTNYLSIIFSSQGKPVAFKVIPITDAGEIPAHLARETKPSGFLDLEKNSIESAYLCGEDLSPSLVESVKKVIGIDFIHFNPFTNLQPGSGIFMNKNYTERSNSFSPAAGIALRTN